MSDTNVVTLPTDSERTDMDNMSLWNQVCKTDPANTKAANVKGNKITSIAPQSQIMEATRMFGPYGSDWGFESIEFDYSLKDIGLVMFNAVFYYPNQQDSSKKESFPISNSVSLYKDNAKTKVDDDFAKKVETDTLTKALSKIGFNADVFMGCFDDVKYVNDAKQEFEQKKNPPEEACEEVQAILKMIQENNVQAVHNSWQGMIKAYWNKLGPVSTDALNKMIQAPINTTNNSANK